MPYAATRELPATVRAKIKGKTRRRQWMQVFNSELKSHGDESRAFATAWAATKRSGGVSKRALSKRAQAEAVVRRDAFLYMDPSLPTKTFAQCGTCVMFMPDTSRCGIHGPRREVSPDASCNLYINGDPTVEQFIATLAPSVSGLVRRQVRCENCKFFHSPDVCVLFAHLNAAMPQVFDLNPTINARGCCNAQTPRSDVDAL